MPKIDPYIYPGTYVLINKFGFRNQTDLDKAESDFTVLKLAEMSENPLPGDYGLAHLCDMHGYVFNDLYSWAGELRTIDIEKSELALSGLSVEYGKHDSLERELVSVLAEMQDSDWSALDLSEKVELFA